MEELNERGPSPSITHYVSPENAPWYNVPNKSVVSVESPFIVRDVDKGLQTLGDPKKLHTVSRIKT